LWGVLCRCPDQGERGGPINPWCSTLGGSEGSGILNYDPICVCLANVILLHFDQDGGVKIVPFSIEIANSQRRYEAYIFFKK
jgi:hypothetical protein